MPDAPSPFLPTMSLRGAKTLSRLFQATIGITPEKMHPTIVEDVIPVIFEKDFVLEPNSSKELERIRDYHSKLVFKDGEFLVRIVLLHN